MLFDVTANSTGIKRPQNGFFALDDLDQGLVKAAFPKGDSSADITAKVTTTVPKAAAAVAAAPAGVEEQSDENASPRSATSDTADATAVVEAPLDDKEVKNAFSKYCNEGWQWSWGNALVKIYRFTLLIIKQIYLLFMTLSLPTNHLMLTFRTLPRDFNEPNSNADHLAAKFRNAVMPRRGRLHDKKSKLIKISRAFIECPFLGIPGIVRFIDVRTQWFDEGMQQAFKDGIKQVVIIAAGYDTRAYRFGQPGVHFYEIDLPHASKKKQELVRDLLPVSKYLRPEFVAADLSKVKLADALANTSFDPKKPTLFTAEGLIYYLPPAAVQQLLACISSISSSGSRLMLDFLHLSALRGDIWNPGFETLLLSVYNKGETMYSGLDERPEAIKGMLKMFGFRSQAVLTARDLVETYMPHVQYKAKPPTVSPYFGYLAAEKM